MGYRWNSNTDLLVIRNNVTAILDRSDDRRPLGERVVVSPLEYDVLCDRLIEAFGIPSLPDYCGCIISMWVNSFRLGRDDIFLEKLLSLYKRIPPHAYNNFFNTFIDTFHEFRIDTYGMPLNNIEDIHRLMQKHSLCSSEGE